MCTAEVGLYPKAALVSQPSLEISAPEVAARKLLEVCGRFTSVYHVSIGGCSMPCQYSATYLSLSRASSSTLLGLVKPAARAARMLHTAQAATEPCSSIDQKKKAYRQMRYQYENNACSYRPPSLGCRRLQFKPDYDIKRYRGR